MENKLRGSRFAGFSTLAAMLACYGTATLVGILSVLGVSLAVNPTAQAGVISVFATLAAVLISLSAARHRRFGPSVLGVAGACLILWVMWGQYNWLMEVVGFVALVGSTWWDWRTRKARRPV